jgi:hypothetical protein
MPEDGLVPDPRDSFRRKRASTEEPPPVHGRGNLRTVEMPDGYDYEVLVRSGGDDARCLYHGSTTCKEATRVAQVVRAGRGKRAAKGKGAGAESASGKGGATE